MVTITLTNRNIDAHHQTASINVATGICTLADTQAFEWRHLTSEADFSHPLLTERYIKTSGHLHHYEYDDVDGLLYSAIYVYTALLHADEPLLCQFKISPSIIFKHSTSKNNIYFSIDSQKGAQESIRIAQLEALITQLTGFNFKYSENILIDTMFTMENLPSTVDGDSLYKTSIKIVELLKSPGSTERFELRYIHPSIGFGVYAHSAIAKGDIISLYSGKKLQAPSHLIYAFEKKLDCLGMYLDAWQSGNLMRFINHAPEPNKMSRPILPLLEANIDAANYCLYGIHVVVFCATRDIAKDEQLLVDYGIQAIKAAYEIRFKTNGKFLRVNKKTIWSDAKKKLAQLEIMATHGVNSAQMYLLKRRLLIVVAALSIFIGVLSQI